MNTSERNEVHQIAERLDRWAFWARWAMGGVGALALAGFSFAMLMEGRMSTNEEGDRAQEKVISTLADDVSEARGLAAQRGAEISGLGAKIEAQGRTLNRIDNSLSELTRYLRDERNSR